MSHMSSGPIYIYEEPDPPGDLSSTVERIKELIVRHILTNDVDLNPQHLRLTWMGHKMLGFAYLHEDQLQVAYSGYLVHTPTGWKMNEGKPCSRFSFEPPQDMHTEASDEADLGKLYNALFAAELYDRLAKAI